MPRATQPASLVRFGTDLGGLIAHFLLPPGRRSGWLGLTALIGAAAVALGSAALLVAGLALLSQRWLGPQRRSLAFPYLDPLLPWAGSGAHLGLVAAGAGLGTLLLLGLMARLGPTRGRRWWALAGLLTLLVLSTAVDVAFTEGNGAVMEALSRRSAPAFWGTAVGLISVYLLTLPIQVLTSYGQLRWALAWRRERTNALQAAWLSRQAYYHLQADPLLQTRIDNPDQRISEDVQRAVSSATALGFGFFTSLLALAAYILLLFSISSSLVLTLAVATLLGNGVIGRLVRHLAGLGFRQQAREADYRFALIHGRTHAESLAFLRGEAAVAAELGRRFQAVLSNLEQLIRWRSLVEQSTGLYAFLMQFVPYLVLSAAYFGGRVSLGDLTVGSIAFGQVQGALSFLIDRADDVSSLFASLERISELEAVLPEPGSEPLPAAAQLAAAAGGRRDDDGSGRSGAERSTAAAPETAVETAAETAAEKVPERAAGAGLRLAGLRVAHPAGGPPLVDDLSLSLAPGERLLIRGPSGCGKTSLLRVICGLASPAAGLLSCPPPEQTLVLPQQPFLPLGSLREQLLFPGPRPGEPAPGDALLRRLMERVGLADLLDRHADLAVVEDWSRVLSGGEQQRLGFARLLLRRPALAILDEASSALDLDAEHDLHVQLVAAGPTLVSVGHRPSLRAFHHWELTLLGGGRWRLEPMVVLP